MTSNYRDFTSYVVGSKANDYTVLSSYTDANMQSVPKMSLMRMTMAPGTDKFFSVAPSFQSRLDSFRIAPPASTPISIGDNNVASSGTMMSTSEGARPSSGVDYATMSTAYRSM